jgi:hypothetical protein
MKNLLQRINWLYILVYLLLSGGIFTMTVYLGANLPLNPALTLALMFGLLAATAYGFYAMDEGRGWKWLAIFWGIGAALNGWLFLMVEHYLDTAIGLAAFFFTAAALVMAYAVRRRAAKPQVAEQHSLGTGIERDWYGMTDDERAEVIARDRPTH